MHFVLAQKSCGNGEHNPSPSIPAAVGSKDGLCAPLSWPSYYHDPSERRETRKSKGNTSSESLAGKYISLPQFLNVIFTQSGR